MTKRNNLMKTVFSAVFLALAFVMPFLTGQIPEIGSMLCPMHIPVLLCGFICGWPWGIAVGLLAPLMRPLTLGMPPLFPTALCMAFELAAYGAVAGLMHKYLPRKKILRFSEVCTGIVFSRSEILLCSKAFKMLGGIGKALFTVYH